MFMLNQLINREMLHQILYTIIELQWILFPLPVYLIIRKHYLDQNQLRLLLIVSCWLIIYLIGGWFMQLCRIILCGILAFIILEISIGQFTEVYRQQQKIMLPKESLSQQGKVLKFVITNQRQIRMFKFEETFFVILIIFLWIALKAYFSEAYSFGLNRQLPDQSIFNGFLVTYHGWNCNYIQYTVIPLIWLIVIFASHIMNNCCHKYTALYLWKQKQKIQNSYTFYLINYLIMPLQIALLVETIYNFVAHKVSLGILQCYPFWKYGVLFQLVINWSIPLITLYFFYKKNGKFEIDDKSNQNRRNSQKYSKDDNLQTPFRYSYEMKMIGSQYIYQGK